MNEHPTIDDLEDLVKAAASGKPPNPRILEHLLGKCHPCLELLRAISLSRGVVAERFTAPLSRFVAKEAQYDYDAAFARAESALSFFLVGDLPAIEPPPSLLAELVPLSMAEQFPLKLDERHLAIPLLVKWLVERSHASRYDAPEKMLHWALMAHLAADSCSRAAARSREHLADLKGFALTQLANALRVMGRMEEAHNAMATAESHLAKGTGDLSLRARLLQYKASIHNAERKCADAILLARESSWIAEDVGEILLLRQALVIESMAQLYGGDPEEAIQPLRRALRRINPVEDPEILFNVQHNLVQCHLTLRQPEKALSLHRKLHLLEDRPQFATILPRADWQEGLLWILQGNPETALVALLRAREGFIKLKLRCETIIVSQDLLKAYAQLGRKTEMNQIEAENRSLSTGSQMEPEAQLLEKFAGPSGKC